MPRSRIHILIAAGFLSRLPRYTMTEFKQIIGRGTRVRDDYDKLWFNIVDYTGSATRLFADPDFDGDPVRITEEELSEDGETKVISDVPIAEEPEEAGPEIVEPRATSGENSISMAARSRLRRISSTSSTQTGSSCG